MHRNANRLMLVAMAATLATTAQAQSPNNAGATTPAQGQTSGAMTSGDTAVTSTRTTSTSTGDVDDHGSGSKAGWLGLLGLLGLLGMRRRGPDTVTRTGYTTGTGPGTTGGTTGRV